MIHFYFVNYGTALRAMPAFECEINVRFLLLLFAATSDEP